MNAVMDKVKIKNLAIDLIQIDRGTQFRASINDAKVGEYSEILDGVTEWPFDTPCEVFFDGTDYYLVDGFHRYLGAKRIGRASVRCVIRDGSLRDAIKFALSANARHGLHRSNEDKRKAVDFALCDVEWRRLSNRAIAELCGVSEYLVRDMVNENRNEEKARADQHQDSPAIKSQVEEKRTGRDGKSYSQPKLKQEPEEDAAEPEYADVEQDEEQPVETQAEKLSPAKQAIQNGKQLQPLQTAVNDLLNMVGNIPHMEGLELFHARINRIRKDIEAVKGHLVTVRPHSVCPRCNGVGCPQCGNHGWVSSATLKELGK
jgi:ParB-like chromosome segregation protein Spo0J